VRHKADLASLICRTRSDQTVVLKEKSRVELGLKSKSAVQGKIYMSTTLTVNSASHFPYLLLDLKGLLVN